MSGWLINHHLQGAGYILWRPRPTTSRTACNYDICLLMSLICIAVYESLIKLKQSATMMPSFSDENSYWRSVIVELFNFLNFYERLWACCLYPCASITEQYNLVPAKWRWRSGEVTAGLAESNGSRPRGLWLRSSAGWLPRTGISSGARSKLVPSVKVSFRPLSFKVLSCGSMLTCCRLCTL